MGHYQCCSRKECSTISNNWSNAMSFSSRKHHNIIISILLILQNPPLFPCIVLLKIYRVTFIYFASCTGHVTSKILENTKALPCKKTYSTHALTYTEQYTVPYGLCFCSVENVSTLDTCMIPLAIPSPVAVLASESFTLITIGL